ncbi:hypothetical protein [Candidatus Amarobacter glycogenicus]|uniref:hypothetical protein n=1 Tax=Candidatus Amarobacter glycogenicus TaxID=3140699 RepID=UPI0031CC8547
MTEKTNLYDLSFDELTAFVTDLGQPKFRAQQVWDWLYKQFALDFEAMSNLSKPLRAQLAEQSTLHIGLSGDELYSSDGRTKKCFFNSPMASTSKPS